MPVYANSKRLFIGLLVIAVAAALILGLPQYMYFMQGRAIFSDAKSVFDSAGIVIRENVVHEVSDREFMQGLSGNYIDDPADFWSSPVSARISTRLNSLVPARVVFADEPEEDKAHVSFTVENGVITGMLYQTIKGGRLFSVIYKDGETKITHEKLTDPEE
jgi:hypothetical protein